MIFIFNYCLETIYLPFVLAAPSQDFPIQLFFQSRFDFLKTSRKMLKCVSFLVDVAVHIESKRSKIKLLLSSV